MDRTKQILIILAHPYPHRSKVNRSLAEKVQDLDGVTLVDLYERYPDFYIDVEAEQHQLVAADLVIFQHPFYWYSAPALLKHWQDVVLEEGFAFGKNGNALRGKAFMSAVTAGHSERSYQHDGYDRYPINVFLRPYEQMAVHCGMRCLPPFVIYSSNRLETEAIEIQATNYRQCLVEYLAGKENG